MAVVALSLLCRMQGEDGCRIRLSAIADPYVMLYEGKYYAYGTGGTVEGEALPASLPMI